MLKSELCVERNYLSSEMIRRLFKLVRRRGLPDNFINKRCLNCCYNVRVRDTYGENIVTCLIVLCPYIGKGYIYKGKTAVQRSIDRQ